MSSNTLAVPMGSGYPGIDQTQFSSYGDLSYGSTFSLGDGSVTSEYVKDAGDAFSPNICMGHSSTFSFGSAGGIEASLKTKDLPWMKVRLCVNLMIYENQTRKKSHPGVCIGGMGVCVLSKTLMFRIFFEGSFELTKFF